MERSKVLSAIIHKELEPGVINDAMINAAIVELGYKGEAARLSQLEPIVYNEINSLRLEFQNILRIDHLWVLPNLTKLSLNFNKLDKIENLHMLVNLIELDLSFNYIEKIENIEKLTKIEVLTFFSNSLTKLENMDTLLNLMIFSAGNNNINTYEGIERLRFMPKLYSLNLEGNPIAKKTGDKSLRVYIAAFLPNLKYYEYIIIKDEERSYGQEVHKREIRELYEVEKEEILKRNTEAQNIADDIKLEASFVENLNEHQLFDELFLNDEDGIALLKIGEALEENLNEYRLEAYILTQQMYKLGLSSHEEHLKEIEIFQECITESRIISQKEGQVIIKDFLKRLPEYTEPAKKLIYIIEKEILNGTFEDETAEYADACNKLDTIIKNNNDDIDKVWQQLMEIEISLFERAEEAITQFGLTLKDLMNEFIEQIQTLFVTFRDQESVFCDGVTEAVQKYVGAKIAAGDEENVPEELKECLEDKDAIMNLVAGMRDNHMQKIDAREDKLLTRGNAWITSISEQLEIDEVNRNRSKIMEINYFLDKQRNLFDLIEAEIHEDLKSKED